LKLEKGGFFRLYDGPMDEFEKTLRGLASDIYELWGQAIKGTGESVRGRVVKKVRGMGYVEALQELGDTRTRSLFQQQSCFRLSTLV